MYWSAHVGTQENGWHDVMKNATQSSNNISHDPIATAIGNNNLCEDSETQALNILLLRQEVYLRIRDHSLLTTGVFQFIQYTGVLTSM